LKHLLPRPASISDGEIPQRCTEAKSHKNVRIIRLSARQGEGAYLDGSRQSRWDQDTFDHAESSKSEGIDPEQEWEEIELDLPNHPDYADRYVRTQIRAMARETHDAEREMVIPKLPLIDSKGCRERLFRGWPRDRAFLDAFES